nr:TIM barrel protein [Candidatus Sigynarchaeota archaeon]
MSTVQDFDFFNHFIPTHTCDFSSNIESEARLAITSAFLQRYPVPDVGFEFIVFPRTLDQATIHKQVDTYNHVKSKIESKFGTRVHASLHFPTTNDSKLSLATNDASTMEKVLHLARGCARLATDAGIDTIVIHTGANITMGEWSRMDHAREAKEAILQHVAMNLPVFMQTMFDENGYEGNLAWENVPYPFDIPAFTHTNLVSDDFIRVFDQLGANGMMDARLGICLDMCHTWILSKVASHFATEYTRMRANKTPPGIYPHEHDEFIESRDPNRLIGIFGERIVHVHLADSRDPFDPVSGTQPTEGDELGTGDLTASAAFTDGLKGIMDARARAGKKGKLKCNLEIKDSDFSRPEKTARSLMYLGERFWKKM